MDTPTVPLRVAEACTLTPKVSFHLIMVQGSGTFISALYLFRHTYPVSLVSLIIGDLIMMGQREDFLRPSTLARAWHDEGSLAMEGRNRRMLGRRMLGRRSGIHQVRRHLGTELVFVLCV